MIDNIEFKNSKSALETKKSPSKKESKDKGGTKKSLRQLQMRIKTLVNSRCEKTCSSKSFGTHS